MHKFDLELQLVCNLCYDMIASLYFDGFQHIHRMEQCTTNLIKSSTLLFSFSLLSIWRGEYVRVFLKDRNDFVLFSSTSIRWQYVCEYFVI